MSYLYDLRGKKKKSRNPYETFITNLTLWEKLKFLMIVKISSPHSLGQVFESSTLHYKFKFILNI